LEIIAEALMNATALFSHDFLARRLLNKLDDGCLNNLEFRHLNISISLM